MEGLWAGRRTIGQVAGHKINLEIEGVQDKIKYMTTSVKRHRANLIRLRSLSHRARFATTAFFLIAVKLRGCKMCPLF